MLVGGRVNEAAGSTIGEQKGDGPEALGRRARAFCSRTSTTKKTFFASAMGVGVALTLRGCKSPPPAPTRSPAFVPFVRFGLGALRRNRGAFRERSEKCSVPLRSLPVIGTVGAGLSAHALTAGEPDPMTFDLANTSARQ
jgi:hypothetical protein